jgi:glycosyltransferase involved in cell wall biosynthesis
MRIGIDAREIKNSHTGTGMYVVNLIKSLANLDSNNEYVLFVDKGEKLDLDLPHNFQYYNLCFGFLNKFQDQIIIPVAIYLSEVDKFHVIHHDATPFLTHVPLIITVLDIAWVDFPGGTSKLFQKYYYLITKYSLRKAYRIITISESTKNRILINYPILPSKIKPILIACDPIFSLKNIGYDFNLLCAEFSIQKPYVLYVGSFAARKNVKALIQAMKKYWDKYDKSIQLILASKLSGKDDIFPDDLINNYPITIISRTKSNIELKSLYENASLFVFPSIYEGFGLPLLEAMTCGCPVIASNSTSLPEIFKNKNYLFDPLDIDVIYDLIQNVLNNKTLQSELSSAVIEESLEFSWNRVAIETLNTYSI